MSLGHPDRTCDSVASYILDEYIRHDPKTRFALEVQLKDFVCNLAGEVTSTWQPKKDEIEVLVRKAIRKVGYTSQYAEKWPELATLNADWITVHNYIGQQSPNIAQGVDREGWGDQGAMMGMATSCKNFGYMPKDRYFAHEIGKRLYNEALSEDALFGLDIKVLVSTTRGMNLEQVVVAAPILPENDRLARKRITEIVCETVGEHNHNCDELIINGTGSYVIHSSVGDAGVVGRKLAVDFYGLNCPIGGGATFGKDATKADVTLNIAARYLALKELLSSGGKYSVVYTKIACCIGQSKCLVAYFDENNDVFKQEAIDIIPSKAIHKFGLDGSVREDMFFSLCQNGLFWHVDELAQRECGCK